MNVCVCVCGGGGVKIGTHTSSVWAGSVLETQT